ncbi:hypothetical protein [uncultured Oscillibacter sp.]|uniref:hypothetical protein n=1 Tax=uncultured Oscillibacter sp. TaxID=876091 RepID=UPI00262A5B51|nr:hypothetical protein [uncultured Oscillibacter sp.]
MKNLKSFLSGVFAALALTACLGTALAAAGQVSFNFVSVSMDGQQRITAGQDITAANGQKVPGSILYTDPAGGKTNYLPIRAVSELLGVEIGYDSATKTVLLGKQSVQTAPPEEGSVIDLRTPSAVPENPRRGDEALIKSRGGTILPDDEPQSYRGNAKMFRDRNGTLRFEYPVGNLSALNSQDKALAEKYLVNGDYPKNEKGESYGLGQLADYVGYEPDLAKMGDEYVRMAERQAEFDKLSGLSKEECPHAYTYYLYDQEGEVIREQTDPCQGHYEGMSLEEVMRAVEEGRLW